MINKVFVREAPSEAALTSVTDPTTLVPPPSPSPLNSRMELETPQPDHPRLTSFECRNRQWCFAYSSRDLIFEKTVDLQGTLLGSKINPLTRAQMIDWMIEVLSNLGRQFSEATFFRATQLMDMHIKLARTGLTDASIHLIGLTCMYIGSKYEDVEPLRIQELARDAAYNKFTPHQIREKEVQILHSVKYQTSFKTHLEVLDFFYFKVFGGCVSENTRLLRDLSRNLCIATLASATFNDYDVRFVVLSCLLNAAAYLSMMAQAGRPIDRPGIRIHCSRRSSHKVTSSDEGQGNFADALEFTEIARRMRGFVETEIHRGRCPGEIWQLVEFVRGYIKKFRKDYQVCPQMCRLVGLDAKYLTKDGA